MNQSQREFWRGSMLLLGCNAVAGLLNYGFQVLAAKRLSVADYGLLNAWLADVTIMLAAGSVAQMLANYFPVRASQLKLMSTLLMIFCLGIMSAVGGIAMNGAAHPGAAALASLALGMASGWLGGQVQARLKFGVLGVALMGGAAAKLTVGILPLGSDALATFYLAVPTSFFVVAMVIAGIQFRSNDDQVPLVEHADRMAIRIVCACILALATALIPQLDIINLRQSQATVVIGQYSRVMLAAKAIFFGAATMLQVALPLYLRAQDASMDKAAHRAIRRAELTVVGVCLLVALAAAWFGPWLGMSILGFDLYDYQAWLLLTGVIASLQFALLQEIQRDCAQLAWRRAVVTLGAILLVLVAGQLMTFASAGSYLGLACAFYAVLLGLRLGLVRP